MNAIANAKLASAIFVGMDTDALQSHRQARLKALAEKLGGKAALGRALGYEDGAYVGQMIAGLRPITEKTIAAAERKTGYKDWFSTTAPPVPTEQYSNLNPEEQRLLDNFRVLLDEDQVSIAEDVANRASRMRAYTAKVLARFGASGGAPEFPRHLEDEAEKAQQRATTSRPKAG